MPVKFIKTVFWELSLEEKVINMDLDTIKNALLLRPYSNWSFCQSHGSKCRIHTVSQRNPLLP
jgi:hypothetical protein